MTFLLLDWKTCADLVLKLISPVLILDQLECYTSLANHLLERKIIEGARNVADSITSKIDQLDSQVTNSFTDHQIGSFIHLAVTFEENVKTSNLERTLTVFRMFTQLEIHRQCRFINDCQESHFIQQRKGSRSSRKLLLKLCSSLAFNDRLDPSSFAFHSVSLALIKSFLQLDAEDSLRKLIDKICLCNGDTRGDNFENGCGLVLDSILSSPYEIMHVYFISPSGRAAVKILQDAGVRQVERIARFLPKTPARASTQIIPTNSTFLQNSVDDLVDSWVSGIVRQVGHKNGRLSSAAALVECRNLSTGLVRLIVDTLMEVWVNGLCRRLDVLNLATCNRILSSTAPSEEDNLAQEHLHEEVNDCIGLYMRNEKGKYPAEHATDIFHPLIEKLSTQRLSELLVSIHKIETEEKRRSLKEHPTCLNLFRFIAQEFAKREDLFLLQESPNDLDDVMACLFWLRDDLSFPFAQQILSSFSSPKNSDAMSTVESGLCVLVNQQMDQLELSSQGESAVGDPDQLEKLGVEQISFQEIESEGSAVLDVNGHIA